MAVADQFILRDARRGDIGTLRRLIVALARYEKLEQEALATDDLLATALFSSPPRAHAVIGEIDGRAVAFAIWFYSFSTFVGRPGIYLEDIYVEPEARKIGIGTAILKYLAARAVREGCGRLEWAVLNWNEPAIKFYERIGSVAMNEWHVRRLSGEGLRALAAA
jgi:GNAT superfamily N-acetyltransferase